jgi:RNA polymerase sigma-70 factor (ECF subfamily)
MATLPQDEAAYGRALHIRYLADDRVALEEIWVRYLPPMLVHLRAYIDRGNLYLVDPDLIEEAAYRALMSYQRRPGQYDPERGKSLLGYLRMSALGDLKNLRRQKNPPGGLRVVGIDDEAWNRQVADDGDLEDDVVEEEAQTRWRDRIYAVARSDEDRTILGLMIRGERRTETYAQALGLTHRSIKDQESYVYKAKERLTRRLKRQAQSGDVDG